MFSKINVLPIVVAHLCTHTDGINPRILWRDLFLFYGLPAVVAAGWWKWGPQPTTNFLETAMWLNALLIPLVFNVLFVIYGIQEKRGPEADADVSTLLAHLYKNICYTILLFFLLVVVCIFGRVLGNEEFAKNYPAWQARLWPVNCVVMYWLCTHVGLNLLMIFKRTYVLLDHGFRATSRP